MSFQYYQDYQKEQAEFRLRMARIAVAFVLFLIFCWMNWWVMPYVAIAHLDSEEAKMSKSGHLLVYRQDNDIVNYRVLRSFENSWDSIPAAWPYMLAGMIPALAIGYCIGELVRWRFAIDEASRDAIKEARQIKSDAEEIDFEAREIISEVNKLHYELFYLKNRLHVELATCCAVTLNAEDKIRNCELKLGEMPKVEQELVKAKGVIEKLNKRISRNKNGKDNKTNG